MCHDYFPKRFTKSQNSVSCYSHAWYIYVWKFIQQASWSIFLNCAWCKPCRLQKFGKLLYVYRPITSNHTCSFSIPIYIYMHVYNSSWLAIIWISICILRFDARLIDCERHMQYKPNYCELHANCMRMLTKALCMHACLSIAIYAKIRNSQLKQPRFETR